MERRKRNQFKLRISLSFYKTDHFYAFCEQHQIAQFVRNELGCLEVTGQCHLKTDLSWNESTFHNFISLLSRSACNAAKHIHLRNFFVSLYRKELLQTTKNSHLETTARIFLFFSWVKISTSASLLAKRSEGDNRLILAMVNCVS